MRLLLIHQGAPEASALEREFFGRADLRVHHSLESAVRDLATTAWPPHLVVIDLRVETGGDLALLAQLRERIGETPIVIGAVTAAPIVTALLGSGGKKDDPLARRTDLGGMLEAVLEQQRILTQALAGQRTQVLAEVDRLATRAAEAAIEKSLDGLRAKLGIDDPDGLKLAARTARGWEDLRMRFVSAMATGIASAFLLAIGAGIVAIFRGTNAK